MNDCMKKALLAASTNLDDMDCFAQEHLSEMFAQHNFVAKTFLLPASDAGIDADLSCVSCLFIVTPQMGGYSTMAEALQSCHENSATIFCALDNVLDQSFTSKQLASLELAGKLVNKLGGHYCTSIQEVSDALALIKEKR